MELTGRTGAAKLGSQVPFAARMLLLTSTFCLAALGNSPPTAVSVTPSSGSGLQHTFAFLSSDPDGGTDITGLQLLFASTAGYSNACDFWIDRGSSGIWLRDDANTGWGSPVIAGQTGTLQNSQCSLNSAASSIVASGTNLTVSLTVTFKPAFTGTHSVTMELLDTVNNHVGPVQRGTWTVGANAAPTAVSITPSSGSGNQQSFVYLASDPDGGTDISGLQLLFASAAGYSNACDFWIDRGSNGIWIRDDANTTWGNPVIAGATGTLQNSQCILNAASSSIVASGNNLTVTLALTFKTAFAGTHSTTMELLDSANNHTGPVTMGSWTVSGPPDFTIAVSPANVTTQAGTVAHYTVTVTGFFGFGGAVSLSTLGLPGGATPSFSPVSPVTVPVNGSVQTALSVGTTSSLYGTYGFTVTGSSGTLAHGAAASLNSVIPDYSVTASPAYPAALTVAAGSSANYGVLVVGLNGFHGIVFLNPQPIQPTGIHLTAGVANLSSSSSVQTTMNISVDQGTPASSFSLQFFGVAGSLSHTVNVNLVTTTTPLAASCSAFPTQGIVGQAVTFSATPTGGTQPYTYSWSGGTVTGTGPSAAFTPNTAGTYNATVAITDAAHNTATSSPCSVTVSAPLAIATTSPLPSGLVGTAYNPQNAQTFTPVNGSGSPPYIWSAVGQPPGLSLSPDGILSGMPLFANTYSFQVQVTDSQNHTATQTFSITISLSMSIQTTSPLPSGMVASTYSKTFLAGGGSGTYTWSQTSGSPPPGLTLSGGGVLSGTPTSTGTYTFGVHVQDQLGQHPTADSNFSITIGNAISITPTTLPNAMLGSAYSQTLTASGGAGGPYTWSLVSGSLPAGLTLSSTGLLSGTTTAAAGPYTFTVKATDNAGNPGTAQFTLTVSAIAITPASLPNATIGYQYSQQLTATGGTAPYTWTLLSGSLPAGLTLSSTGLLSGTTTAAAGPYTFAVKATDSTSKTGTLQYTLTVSGPSVKEYIRMGGRVIAIEDH